MVVYEYTRDDADITPELSMSLSIYDKYKFKLVVDDAKIIKYMVAYGNDCIIINCFDTLMFDNIYSNTIKNKIIIFYRKPVLFDGIYSRVEGMKNLLFILNSFSFAVRIKESIKKLNKKLKL